jgi:hypothetical protein
MCNILAWREEKWGIFTSLKDQQLFAHFQKNIQHLSVNNIVVQRVLNHLQMTVEAFSPSYDLAPPPPSPLPLFRL